jgi:shikimate kinase
VRRVGRKETRPLLKDGDAHAILKKLMDEREADYARADIQVESQPGEHELTVDLIIDSLAETLGVAPHDSGTAPS